MMVLAALILALLMLCTWMLISTYSFPTIVLCFSWFFVLVLQAIFASDMYFGIDAVIIVSVISIAFAFGNVIGSGLQNGELPKKNSNTEQVKIECFGSERWIRYWIVIFVIISMLGAIRYILALGLLDAGSIGNALSVIGSTRAKLMSGEIYISMMDRIGFLFSYSGVVLSLTYWILYRFRWWLLLSPFVVLILGASQAGRAGTFMILFQWLAAILIKKISEQNYRIPKIVFAIPIIILLVFFGGHLLRNENKKITTTSMVEILNSSRIYLFGGTSGFSYYCEHVWRTKPLSYGRYTFSSLFSFVGLANQEVGVYDQYVPVSPCGEKTNIFSAYRSFIEDFSMVGAIGIFCFLGWLFSLLLLKLKAGDLRYAAIFIPMVSFLMFSPMASLTYFNSFLMSLVVPFAIVIFGKK